MGAETLANACLINLTEIAAFQKTEHPDQKETACTIPNPVDLIATKSSDAIEFTNGLTLDCEYAAAMAQFMAQIVQPLAKYHVGEPLILVHSGEGYVCRRRNNAHTGKLSEHAFGNAMDLVSFEFASGRRLQVRSADSMSADEAKFFNAVRQAACGAFTTVLGPGSNAAHAAHLHLDLGRAKGRKNPYRICE